MTEGQIPVNLNDLPIDSAVLDDSSVYTGELTKATLSPKRDKNGNAYCAIQVAITEGDFEGKTVMRNYLALPTAITEDMTKRDRIKAQDNAVAFARFARAFGLKGNMPGIGATFDASNVESWQSWIALAYGNTGKITVQNQEYPEGSGRMRSGINDFIF